MQGFGARLAARVKELGLSNAEVGRSQRAPVWELRHRLPRTGPTNAGHAGKGLGGNHRRTASHIKKVGTNRERLLDQIEAALRQVSDVDLEIISVQVRALLNGRRD